MINERVRAGEALPMGLGSYQERCLWLAELAPGVLAPEEARRASDRATLHAVVERAARLGVAPRWLAFGEVQAGADPIGMGLRLRTQRQPRMGQRALAKQAGVSIGMISTLESAAGGKPSPSIEMILKLAEALEVAPGWLAFGGDPAPMADPAANPSPAVPPRAPPVQAWGVLPVQGGEEPWEAWANARPTPSQGPERLAPPQSPAAPPQRLRFVAVNLPAPPDLTSRRRRSGHGGPWWDFQIPPCGPGVDLLKLNPAEIHDLAQHLKTLLPVGWALARWHFGPTPERVALRALPTHLGGLPTELRERVLQEGQRLAPAPPPVVLDPGVLPSQQAAHLISLARQAVEQREESAKLRRWAQAFDPAPLRRCGCGKLCHATHLGAAQHAAFQILIEGAGRLQIFECQISKTLHAGRPHAPGARRRHR